MNLDLSDEEKAALVRELDRIIQDDRFPMSPRIMTFKAILAKLRPDRSGNHYLHRSIMSRRERGFTAEGVKNRGSSIVRGHQFVIR
jgi:hypothetical protein